jgi:hypothetical protein
MEDDEDVLFGDGEEQLAALSDLEVSGEEGDEEDAAGQPVGWRALRAKLQQEEEQQEGQEQGASSGSEGEDEGGDGGDKEARRAALAEKRSQLQRLVEEYYKLDYEDNISGIPCRFRYKEVRWCRVTVGGVAGDSQAPVLSVHIGGSAAVGGVMTGCARQCMLRGSPPSRRLSRCRLACRPA